MEYKDVSQIKNNPFQYNISLNDSKINRNNYTINLLYNYKLSMEYSKIINPNTGISYSIFDTDGEQILKKFILSYKKGGTNPEELENRIRTALVNAKKYNIDVVVRYPTKPGMFPDSKIITGNIIDNDNTNTTKNDYPFKIKDTNGEAISINLENFRAKSPYGNFNIIEQFKFNSKLFQHRIRNLNKLAASEVARIKAEEEAAAEAARVKAKGEAAAEAARTKLKKKLLLKLLVSKLKKKKLLLKLLLKLLVSKLKKKKLLLKLLVSKLKKKLPLN